MITPELNPFPEYGDMLTIKEWLQMVDCGGFIDYDGYGQLATKDGVGEYIYPSDITAKHKEIPKWVTHIVWYNR